MLLAGTLLNSKITSTKRKQPNTTMVWEMGQGGGGGFRGRMKWWQKENGVDGCQVAFYPASALCIQFRIAQYNAPEDQGTEGQDCCIL